MTTHETPWGRPTLRERPVTERPVTGRAAAPRVLPRLSRVPDGRSTRRVKGGRPRGARNVVTREIKQALIDAAEMIGRDGHGDLGLVGYLIRLERRAPQTFGALIGRLMPTQVTGPDGGPVRVSVREELTQRIMLISQRVDDDFVVPEPRDLRLVGTSVPEVPPSSPPRDLVR